MRTSSLASSDSQASLVSASPLVGLALAGGGLARSDQEPPSSADTEMVGALGWGYHIILCQDDEERKVVGLTFLSMF